jgi:hypothetical protein
MANIVYVSHRDIVKSKSDRIYRITMDFLRKKGLSQRFIFLTGDSDFPPDLVGVPPEILESNSEPGFIWTLYDWMQEQRIKRIEKGRITLVDKRVISGNSNKILLGKPEDIYDMIHIDPMWYFISYNSNRFEGISNELAVIYRKRSSIFPWKRTSWEVMDDTLKTRFRLDAERLEFNRALRIRNDFRDII